MNFASVVERLQTLENPYPGLRPFETEESHLFFGRDVQVAELVGRLERNRFVAVLGVSGSGKSSLVRAGLIPALERGRVSEAGRRWRMVVTRPGGAPFTCLGADLGKAGLDAARLTDSSHGLIEIARQLPPDESLLVVVDQFEELFRYKDLLFVNEEARRRHDALAAEASEFVQLLLAAGRHQPPVYIVLTMRSDYLGDCAEFRDLPETLNDCQYLVPRMTREQRKQAIEGPLGRVEIAPALVQRMLNDAGDEPDQLPVLQHALMRTWSHWRAADPDRARRIELQDYQAIGELDGALDQHANELLAGTPVDITASVFKRLTARGRSRRERRNPARLSELMAVCGAEGPERSARVLAVLDRFRRGEATFLTPRDGPLTADTYIDITHESLIRQWKKLRDEWLPEERASAKTFLELVERARAWKNKQGELLAGLDLSNALRWASERNPTSAWAEHYSGPSALEDVLGFIRASDEHRLADLTRRRRQRLRTRLIAGTLIATGIVGAFYYQYATARAARENALAARLRSVRSVRDPLTRALLLAELADHARPEHLTIYQEAATTAIPVAVLPYRQDPGAVGAGFLGDGRIAVALADGSLQSWGGDGRGDAAVAALPIEGPAGGDTVTLMPLTAAVFSHDGRRMAAGLASGAVWFGPTDGKASQPPTADEAGASTGPARVTALAFSRDGRQLAAGYGDYTARVWPLESTREGLLTTAPVPLPAAHTGPITSIGFDPAGTRLVTGSLDGTTRIWNLGEPASPGAVIDSNGDQVTSVAFSPDGTWVFSGYRSGAIRISKSDGQDGSGELAELGHAAAVTFVAFSPDGSRLVTTSEDRTARIWLVATRAASGEHRPGPLKVVVPTAVLMHQAAVTVGAFSRDGTRVATWSADGAARLWRSEPGEPRVLGLHAGRVESVAFSKDAKQVVSASDDGTARIWSLDGQTRSRVLAGHSNWVRGAAFSPADGRRVVTASDDGTVRFWDLAAPGKHRVSPELDGVFSADFNSEGTRLVTAVKDNTARIWRVSGFDLEGPMLELRHDEWVRSAAFSTDGSKVVTATRKGEVRVWDTVTDEGEPAERFRRPHQTIVYNAAFSPDGSAIVTAGGDGLARVWPLSASEGPSVLLRHDSDVYKAAFSADGDSIVTASRDGTAVVWNAKDGSERLVLQNGTVPVWSASFSPLGNEVVTGDSAGVVRVWRVGLADLKAHVVRLARTSTSCLSATIRTQFLEESMDQARRRYEQCERNNDRTPAPAP